MFDHHASRGARPGISVRLLTAAVTAAALGTLAPAGTARAQTFTPAGIPDIAAHVSFSLGASWVDYDNDGDLDLYVVTGFAPNNDNVLYRNDGGGALTRVTGVPLTMDAAESACSTWGDYDNDGDIDAFVSNLVNRGGLLYEGHAGADLTLNSAAGITEAAGKGTGAAWGDYDNDGQLDLVVAALYGQGGINTGNLLYHNSGDGTFARVLTGPEVSTLDSHHHPTWSDYDGDGDLDLFFATGGAGSLKLDRIYRNMLKESGAATFEPITTGPIATDFRDAQTLSWVDYDNDGDLDLYAINYSSVPNQLYRNDGGAFTKITTGAIVTDAGAAHGVVWGDFDNDGDQDAYVVRDLHQSNRYYRNEGDGSFTSIVTGSFVNEGLSNYGAAAGDYDRDGDLDLFVPTARREGPSLLYRNDLANGNHWLTLRCQGTLSNRSGIGAKVRVHATIDGQPRWQMREILAGTSYGGHNALEAHFGLGNAALVDSVRVEWPDGLVDRFANVAAGQTLTIVENSTVPVLASVERASAGARGVALEWHLFGFDGRTVTVERAESADGWATLGSVRVAPRGRVPFADASARPGRRYGYRLRLEGPDGPPGGGPVGEIWLDVPAGARFGISPLGSPAAGGALLLQIELEVDEPASIALYGVDGRRVLAGPGIAALAGRQVVRLQLPGALGAGVYFAELRQGARRATARITLSR